MIRVSTWRDATTGEFHSEIKTDAPYSPDVLRDIVNAAINLHDVDAIIDPPDADLERHLAD